MFRKQKSLNYYIDKLQNGVYLQFDEDLMKEMYPLLLSELQLDECDVQYGKGIFFDPNPLSEYLTKVKTKILKNKPNKMIYVTEIFSKNGNKQVYNRTFNGYTYTEEFYLYADNVRYSFFFGNNGVPAVVRTTIYKNDYLVEFYQERKQGHQKKLFYYECERVTKICSFNKEYNRNSSAIHYIEYNELDKVQKIRVDAVLENGQKYSRTVYTMSKSSLKIKDAERLVKDFYKDYIKKVINENQANRKVFSIILTYSDANDTFFPVHLAIGDEGEHQKLKGKGILTVLNPAEYNSQYEIRVEEGSLTFDAFNKLNQSLDNKQNNSKGVKLLEVICRELIEEELMMSNQICDYAVIFPINLELKDIEKIVKKLNNLKDLSLYE